MSEIAPLTNGIITAIIAGAIMGAVFGCFLAFYKHVNVAPPTHLRQWKSHPWHPNIPKWAVIGSLLTALGVGSAYGIGQIYSGPDSVPVAIFAGTIISVFILVGIFVAAEAAYHNN